MIVIRICSALYKKGWKGSPFPRKGNMGILTSMLGLRHSMFFQPKKQHMPYDTVARNRHSQMSRLTETREQST
jgi:hypothetical protein